MFPLRKSPAFLLSLREQVLQSRDEVLEHVNVERKKQERKLSGVGSPFIYVALLLANK